MRGSCLFTFGTPLEIREDCRLLFLLNRHLAILKALRNFPVLKEKYKAVFGLLSVALIKQSSRLEIDSAGPLAD